MAEKNEAGASPEDEQLDETAGGPDGLPGGDLLGDEIPDAVADSEAGGTGGFAPVTKHFEPQGHKTFDDPAYYKNALSGGGETVQRLHGIFQKLTQTKDPKDRTLFRQQIISVFWTYLGTLARQTVLTLSDAKKFVLRFGILHPGMLTPEHRKLFSTIIIDNISNEPVYYLDEWFAGVGRGEVTPSTTDEGRPTRSNSDAHLKELLDKAQGKLEGARSLLASKDQERTSAEKMLQSRVDAVSAHAPAAVYPQVGDRYSEAQRKVLAEIQDVSKALLKTDRELDVLLRDFENAQRDIATLRGKVEQGAAGGAETALDMGAIDAEFQTIRQMAKMTVGRQGNAFPILSSEYYRCMPNGLGTRENIISVLSWIESIDEEAYFRVYKNKPMRIVPYVILLPTYGDLGVCWEPYERANKATSRGRIAIPMYPKNLTVALLSAVADLRWQVAKEKASYYWMEEGLTGNYYQWFAKQKLKGDIKWYFIQDYLLWMTKESEGTQKVDKEVRGIFWRFMPFTRPIKEKLKDRNLIYQELYQRDLNRAMSDL